MDELLWMNIPCIEPQGPAAGHIAHAKIICLSWWDESQSFIRKILIGGHLMVRTFKAVQ